MTATPPEDPHGPVLEKNAARQGRSGVPIMWVLIIGAVLTAVALFTVWALGAGELAETEPHNARQASDVGIDTDLREPLQTEREASPSPDDGVSNTLPPRKGEPGYPPSQTTEVPPT